MRKPGQTRGRLCFSHVVHQVLIRAKHDGDFGRCDPTSGLVQPRLELAEQGTGLGMSVQGPHHLGWTGLLQPQPLPPVADQEPFQLGMLAFAELAE